MDTLEVQLQACSFFLISFKIRLSVAPTDLFQPLWRKIRVAAVTIPFECLSMPELNELTVIVQQCKIAPIFERIPFHLFPLNPAFGVKIHDSMSPDGSVWYPNANKTVSLFFVDGQYSH